MCHIITLIVPSAAAPVLPAIMRARGRVATEVRNPSLAAVLQPDDRQFLTTKTCDCGTALAPPAGADAPAAPEHHAAKLRKRGWSDAKIARSMADRNTGRAHKRARSVDSLEMWVEIVAEIFEQARAERVALFLRFYSGSLEMEPIQPSRRSASKGFALAETLKTLAEDEVLTFNR